MKIHREKESIDVLASFPFDSNRKRATTVIRRP